MKMMRSRPTRASFRRTLLAAIELHTRRPRGTGSTAASDLPDSSHRTGSNQKRNSTAVPPTANQITHKHARTWRPFRGHSEPRDLRFSLFQGQSGWTVCVRPFHFLAPPAAAASAASFAAASFSAALRACFSLIACASLKRAHKKPAVLARQAKARQERAYSIVTTRHRRTISCTAAVVSQQLLAKYVLRKPRCLLWYVAAPHVVWKTKCKNVFVPGRTNTSITSHCNGIPL